MPQASKGLASVKELYKDRAKRARELKAQGKKVIGYFCCYPPVEVMTAAGCVPYRLMGKVREPITKADAYLETIMCPYVRSVFDVGIKGGYDFMDGLVMPNSCDNVDFSYNVFRYYLKLPYNHYLNVPHNLEPSSYPFFEGEIDDFRKSLGKFTGVEITDQRLKAAIKLHNENRAVLQQLYDLRKQDPPLILGSEMTELVVVGLITPVEEFTQLIKEVISEVKARPQRPPKKDVRLLIYAGEMDESDLMRLIEDAGAHVVIDDMCFGTRSFWGEVDNSTRPVAALAARYLDKVMCPRTFRTAETFQADQDLRFGYLRQFAKEYHANGAILYVLRFCDIHAFDAPDVREYLQKTNVPTLYLEDDYSASAMGQMKTRIQAFVEMAAQG